MASAPRTLAEAYKPRDLPVITEWQASRSGARVTIIGVIDGRAGKLTVDSIEGRAGEVLAYRDLECVAKLSAATLPPPAASAGFDTQSDPLLALDP